ncbi:MAG: GTPase HflX [Armatimonadetes bacterium]|nr:GTPase HflX [Armatimonadota bacterium]MDE2205117.1 GTPase HflX [Armatimonadota bacterium]
MNRRPVHEVNDVERALLVSVEPDETLRPWALEELNELTATAGALVVGDFYQKRDRPDPRTFIGPGKVEELYAGVLDASANLVIVDSELSPTQARNMEEAVKCRVIDRTQLILDIFAQRARTREGKLQVELAQLTYLLPRLSSLYTKFERQQGGIGVRGGFGETKLETDRRKVRDTINDLEAQLAEVRSARQQQRTHRRNLPFPTAAVVGYTSAGKSTLLNTLSGSEVYADPQLFATLDPTTRRVVLPDGWAILVTDTVGFIRNLPTHLVASFRATLEETLEADFLIHVVDAHHPHRDQQHDAVLEVLSSLQIADKPVVTVYNKADLVVDKYELRQLVAEDENACYISATTAEGIPHLVRRVVATLEDLLVEVHLKLPYSRSDLVAQCYEYGRVARVEYADDAILVDAHVTHYLAGRVAAYQEQGRRAAR